jgi:assimilatory nitrate reductase catalytic subunit
MLKSMVQSLWKNPGLRRFDGPLTELLQRQPVDGAGQIPVSLVPSEMIETVCGFCSTGCGLQVHRRGGQPVNITPARGYPVNLGMACPKGWEALAPLKAADRGVMPLLRTEKGGPRETLGWDEAVDVFVEKVRGLKERYGEESFAFLGTGQMPTEEMAMLGTVFKVGMGFVHGDSNTRQCMATTHVAYRESLGFDAPPFSYRDFEESDLLIFVGANPCIAHPILWQRVLMNRRNPWIVVIDPRRTETASAAQQHIAVNSRGDLGLLYGLAKAVIDAGGVCSEYVRDHTEGYEAFAEFLEDFTPERVAEACGVSAEVIRGLAERISRTERVSFWWTMGVNQGYEAVRTAQAIINLALMTGNMGRPGTGANSITGQCNAMGSRLFAMTGTLPAGRDFGSPADRGFTADWLGVDPARIPERKSLEYDRILEGVESGRIRGLWIIATNPAHSWIGRRALRELLGKLEFLVVQDLFADTETAELADLYLPAAGWGEKAGTFINSERRISYTAKVAEPPGGALPDFEIFRRIGLHWGGCPWLEAWTEPEAVFQALQEASKGKPCDHSGVQGYADLREQGGIQWPYPNGSHPGEGERRLFEDGRFFRENGRALFCFEAPAPNPEAVDAAYPLVLITGRGSSAEWHTGTRTSRSAVLRALSGMADRVEMHPEDARKRGLRSGQRVVVESRRGKMEGTLCEEVGVGRGRIFIPMHDGEVNRLTLAAFDPYSRQPSYKACAVEVRAAG